jgi:hypothetical protein
MPIEEYTELIEFKKSITKGDACVTFFNGSFFQRRYLSNENAVRELEEEIFRLKNENNKKPDFKEMSLYKFYKWKMKNN